MISTIAQWNLGGSNSGQARKGFYRKGDTFELAFKNHLVSYLCFRQLYWDIIYLQKYACFYIYSLVFWWIYVSTITPPQIFHHLTPESCPSPFQVNFCFYPCNYWSDFCHYKLVLLNLELHIIESRSRYSFESGFFCSA